MDLERHTIFDLVDKLYQLAKFNGGSFKLKNGTVNHVYIDDKYDEAVIKYRDGGGDYAIDAGGLAVFTAIKNYEYEYPEQYKKFMEVYETNDESQEIDISFENSKDFMSLFNKLDSSQPS